MNGMNADQPEKPPRSPKPIAGRARGFAFLPQSVFILFIGG
jgi:hypothetical protein